MKSYIFPFAAAMCAFGGLSLACPARRSPTAASSSVSLSIAQTAAPQTTVAPIVTQPQAPGPATTLVTSESLKVETQPIATSPTTSIGQAPVPSSDAGGGGSSTGASVSGKSTFYGGNLSSGTCSFSTYTLPAGLYGVAFSGQVWNSAVNCGACVKVTGPNGNSVTAMIVDQCPECDEGHLDLFQNAFLELGTLSAGIIQTSYTFVDCGITSPLVLHNKSGTSPYWFSMQVVGATEAVSKLEVSTDDGNSWRGTTRQPYNFFEYQSGFGTASVDVKVTSKSGKTVIVKGVSVSSDSSTTASSNF